MTPEHTTPEAHVTSGINALTREWLRRDPASPPAMLSAAGVWPLLAALSTASDETAAAELRSATGVPPADAAAAVGSLFDRLATMDGARAALGLWASPDLALDSDWLATLPAGLVGWLSGDPATDGATVDAWAAAQTDGMIPRMPVDTSRPLDLILATAVSLRGRWREPFADSPWRFPSGPWRDLDCHGLTAVSTDLSALRVWPGRLSTLRVPTVEDLDVVLAIGSQDRPPGDVLASAVDSLVEVPPVTGEDLAEGADAPGVDVRTVPDPEPDPVPRLSIVTVAFDVSADHDLTEEAGLFGLTELLRPDHFALTGLADRPCRLEQARQNGVARFSAAGFEAAAVTAMGAVAAGALLPRGTRREVTVSFGRPFGYLAVHRDSGLVLAAGWIDRPREWSFDD